jgi:hypothetical protein
MAERQKWWRRRLFELGHVHHKCNSVDQFQDVILPYVPEWFTVDHLPAALRAYKANVGRWNFQHRCALATRT